MVSGKTRLIVTAASLFISLPGHAQQLATTGATQMLQIDSFVRAVFLTKGECEALGGKVMTTEICNSKKVCARRDENGKTHGVCLEVATTAPAAPSSSGSSTGAAQAPGRSTAVLSIAPVLVSIPLTSQECEGLGGIVSWSTSCNAKGQQACYTVDEHGVVRHLCIGEVAK